MEKSSEIDPFFFDKVLEKVRQIPISEIIYDVYQVPIGFCPFHNDRHAGSFSVVKKFNRYHCFSCGVTGDGIDFVQAQEKLGFQKAVWKLALQFDIVTVQQFEEYVSGSLTNNEVKSPPRVYDGVFDDKEDSPIADNKILHNVFSVFAEGEGLVKKNKRLSKKHLHHLQEERQLTDDEILKSGYFTMPNRSKYFMREFLKELKIRFGYEEDILKEVPGFYWMNQLGGMTFVSHKGIGIPIKNEREQIVGIQIRRDNADLGEKRYVWFSSSFANEKEGMTYGTGSGSPIHISYPKTNHHPEDLFITEGIFKSQQLAKFYQATCISVQGVQNWKGKIDQFIEYLEEEKGQAVYRIHIYFDADVSENIHVYTAFRDMYESLKEQFPYIEFYYYWWNKDFGKGVDDLLLNRLSGEIRKIDCKKYVATYDKMIDDLQEKYGLPKTELDKELIGMTYEAEIAPLFTYLK